MTVSRPVLAAENRFDDVDAASFCRGMLVLSGILTTQAADVAAAYRTAGLPEPETRISGEWASLVWQ